MIGENIWQRAALRLVLLDLKQCAYTGPGDHNNLVFTVRRSVPVLGTFIGLILVI
jgi:hypothetical protein